LPRGAWCSEPFIIAPEIERFFEEEKYGRDEIEQNRLEILHWATASRLKSAMEPKEWEFMNAPIGQPSERIVIASAWRREGLSLLLWALERSQLPAYYLHSDSAEMLQHVGFLIPSSQMDLRRSAKVRPPDQIRPFDRHITIVSWRLRQFFISRDSQISEDSTKAFGAGRSGVGEGRIEWPPRASCRPSRSEDGSTWRRLV
jgi:Domain of unknown function (DUF4272)